MTIILISFSFQFQVEPSGESDKSKRSVYVTCLDPNYLMNTLRKSYPNIEFLQPGDEIAVVSTEYILHSDDSNWIKSTLKRIHGNVKIFVNSLYFHDIDAEYLFPYKNFLAEKNDLKQNVKDINNYKTQFSEQYFVGIAFDNAQEFIKSLHPTSIEFLKDFYFSCDEKNIDDYVAVNHKFEKMPLNPDISRKTLFKDELEHKYYLFLVLKKLGIIDCSGEFTNPFTKNYLYRLIELSR